MCTSTCKKKIELENIFLLKVSQLIQYVITTFEIAQVG